MPPPPPLAAILDQLPESVIVTDLSGRVVYWNRGATRIFGYSADEMVGCSLDVLYPFASHEALALDLERVLAGTDYHGEWVGRAKDGEQRSIAVRTTVLRDERGNPVGFLGTATDVMERKRAIERQLRSEAGYRLVMLASNEAIWDWDLVGGRLDWSEGISTSFGWPSSRVGLDIHWWSERLHPSDRARVNADIEAALASNARTWTDEYRFLRADGTWAEVHDHGYIQRVDGRAVRMVGVMRDVTEERRRSRIDEFMSTAGVILASSHEYERTLAALAPKAVPSIADWCAVDVRGASDEFQRLSIAHGDPADARLAEVLHGYPTLIRPGDESLRAFIVGEPLVVAEVGDPPIEANAHDDAHSRALHAAGITSWLAVPVMVCDRLLGVLTFAQARSGRRFDSRDLEWARELGRRCSSVVALAFAVRERDELLARLRASEERQRLAVEAAAIGTWDLRPDTRELTWDERTRALFGLSPSAPVDYDVFLRAIHPDDRARVDALVQAALDPSGDGAYEADCRVIGLGDGVERTLRARGRAMFEHGRPVRFLGTVHDISELERKEAELRAAMERAEEANRAKDAFLAMLGHELRNPLAPIRTALELMSMRDPTAFRRERAIIERQFNHMVRLVDDLLDVSRIIRGNVELHRAPVDVAEVVAGALETTGALFERQQHTLEVHSEEGLVVDGDRDRLRQVFVNLLTNASKYTEPGGHVTVTVERGDGVARVVVTDTGRGIDSELARRIFEPFAQGWRAIDRREGGLGLGLAIVKTFVELHGGAVSASSPGPGRGSTFEVRLPLCAGATTAVRAATPGKIGRVLVVDDDEEAAGLLAASLERLGWSTRVANDGPSALAAASTFQPDVAVLDIGLPVMDGYELARRMRREGAASRLVALAAYGQRSDRQRARAAGFDEQFVKPVPVSALHGVLRDWMDGQHAHA